MPRVRRNIKRTDEAVESKYRFCPVKKMRLFVGICEDKCEDKKCPISRAKMDKKAKKRLQAATSRRKKKIAEEQKQFDDLGLTRNLLLKPEDIVGGSNT